MALKLLNTMSRQKEALKPISDKTIKLYTCGLTVYSEPHIGNWSAYIYWDILVRTLVADGYKVNHVQNITDVGHLTDDEDQGEDKLQKAAEKARKTAWEIAEYYIGRVEKGRELLRLRKPDHMPRATDYIKQQIDLVKRLERLGYTYSIKGDGIYFDTSKLSDYGKLARLDKEGLQAGSRVAIGDKKSPTDFALWKLSPKNAKRDMEWDSPWGKGFPGWHLECSTMAMDLLGDTIDIHTGGIDHIAVHHTNEIAQTETVTKKPFANIWLHSNHMKVNGKKMSKSLGNVYTLDDIAKKGYTPQSFRLLVLTSHYRTQSNFTWKLMNAAQSRLKRWQSVADMRWQASDDNSHVSGDIMATSIMEAFKALDDDLDTPRALSSLEETFNALEQNPLCKKDQAQFIEFLEFIDVRLGIDLLLPDITSQQKKTIMKREKMRADRDYAGSDKLRDELLEQGIALRDIKTGVLWYRR